MTATKQLTLPITGMTCANCVATVERNLKKLDGVQSAVVNLSSERATVDFDSLKLALTDVIARVNRAGYGVATGDPGRERGIARLQALGKLGGHVVVGQNGFLVVYSPEPANKFPNGLSIGERRRLMAKKSARSVATAFPAAARPRKMRWIPCTPRT